MEKVTGITNPAKIPCAFVLKLPQSPNCLWENISNQSNYVHIFIVNNLTDKLWCEPSLISFSSSTIICHINALHRFQVLFLLLFRIVLKHHYLFIFLFKITAYICIWNLSNNIKQRNEWLFVVNPTLKIIYLHLNWSLHTASTQGISSPLQIKPNSNLRKNSKKEKQ